ncbi:MAG TPA: phosphoserine phosphatase SerB [Trueperaceae bacterium]|nr:phosphoserine phosphatase SerB [Trueperaceae bacterium]
MKLCVFDFDSTLMAGETIDFLAKAVGKENQVSQITEQAMSGEIGFFESLSERAKLLEGLSQRKLEEICHNLPLMNGAKETILALKQKGYKVVIFSGGFRTATSYYAPILGADADFANFLDIKDGLLTGRVAGEMMANDAKGSMLVRLQKLLDIDVTDTLAVGDGANDLSMFKYAGTKIAFCAKDILKDAADYVLDEQDLRLVLEHI